MPERMDLDTTPRTEPPLLSSRDPRLASRPLKLPAIRTTSMDKRPPASAAASPGTPKPATPKPATPSTASPGTPKPATPKPATPSTAQRPVNNSPCGDKHNDAPNNAPGGSFAQAISGLVQASVATAMRKSEKEKLRRRKDNTENLLKKARVHMKFPSTTDFFQQATNDESVDLARVDRAINEHLAISSQIEKDVLRQWGSLSSTDSKSEELIKGLQSELRVAKSDIAKANNETARLAGLLDTGPSCSGPVKVLQDRVVFLEKAVGKQGSVITDQVKDAKENERRLTLLSSEIKNSTSPSQPPQPSFSTINRINAELESLKRQNAALDSGLKAQVTNQEQIRKTVDETNNNKERQRQKSNSDNVLEIIQKKMDVFHHKLTILERKATSPSSPQTPGDDVKAVITNLESRLKALEGNRPTQSPVLPQSTSSTNEKEIQALSQQIQEMTRLQAMKDDLQFGDMETTKENLAKQSEEFQELKAKHSQLSEDVKSVGQNNPGSPSNQQVQSLSMSLQNTQRVMETIRVGLHSLEMRYNSITTEPIVKNMLAAMQELYPSAAQLTEQVNALKAIFERDFLPLRSNVDQLIRSHSTYVSMAQTDSKTIHEELNRIKDEHARMEKSLRGVWDRTASLESFPGHQHFRQLQSTCENLSSYVDERVSKINEQLKSSQDVDDDLRQRLSREHEHFEQENKELSNELKEMGKKFSKLDTENAENLEATKTQWQDISSLLDRVQSLENSAAKNHEQLLLQFDNIKKSMESENLLQSPRLKVETNDRDDQADDSTPNGDFTINQMAEANPALALLQKKKKKRPRAMNMSDDEISSSSVHENTPSERRKAKEDKKRKFRDPDTITLD